MAQIARARMMVTVIDDENWPWDDESEFFNKFEEDVLTDQDDSGTLLKFDECVGDEVRLAGTIVVELLSSRRLRFVGTFQLYEGDDCGTNDREGPAFTFTKTLSPDTRRLVWLTMPGEGGAEAAGYIMLANRNQ